MRPEAISGKKILYACLDWGSGHLARSIPLIRQLEEQGNSLLFMGSPEQHSILQQYGFSGTLAELPPTGFRFRGDGNFLLEGIRNFFSVRKALQQDHQLVSAFAHVQGVDLILSDHRYGVYSRDLPSVFITHQTHLPPGTNFIARWLHRSWMKRFSEIWIMDDEQNRLAGELSNPVADSRYIGHYSRFRDMEITTVPGKVVAIISGPEPYAEQLFNDVVKQVNASDKNWTIVAGKSYPAANGLVSTARIISDWKEADEAIASAELIVSRNGYTTLMDLKVLGKEAILIPTPGQPEQEYLAELHGLTDFGLNVTPLTAAGSSEANPPSA